MMTKRAFLKTMMVGCAAALTGCVGTVDGRKRAGNPMINDKIVSLYEAPITMDIAFKDAKKVLAEIGNLYGENTITYTLEAKVDKRTIYVKVEDVEGNVRITTQVRTSKGGTDLARASEVDKRIAVQMTVTVNELDQ